MKLSDISIKTRLAVSYAAMAVLVICVSALATVSVAREHGTFKSFVSENAKRESFANDILDGANARAISARNLVLVTDGKDRQEEHGQVVVAHEKVGKSLKQLKNALDTTPGITEEERRLYQEIEAVEAKYGPVALNIVGLAMKGERDEAILRMNRDCRPLLASLIKMTNAFIDHEDRNATATLAQADVAAETSRNTLIGAGVLAAVLAAAVAVVMTRSIVQPISRAVDFARTVASGDLSKSIDVTSKDETGQLLAALSEMNGSLVAIVGEVRSGSDSIQTGSAEIATGNADLSSRTEQQAASLQQTAASMEEITSTVKNTADSAQQARQMANAASEAAVRGGEVVSSVVSTMDGISTSSKRISDIIGVMDGIAFQTNILALNAAVEAARAGEQGRGFAVVAAEVRALALRSANAAKEIKGLIDESVMKVSSGTNQVAEARSSMDDIVARVKKVHDLIGEISAAAVEQTSGIGQVNQAVAQLDQTTQQNAALVEQSAAAAQSLRSQAERLTSVVGRFRMT